MDRGELRSLFEYKDGELIWKTKTCSKVIVGRRAGSRKNDGYWQLRHQSRMYYVHRLIWVWHHGEIPPGMVIDHIDRNPSNNRIDNLRLLTHGQNLVNADARADSSTGERGVYRLDDRYRLSYRAQFQQKHLGCFNTIHEARAAYQNAAQAFIAGGAS